IMILIPERRPQADAEKRRAISTVSIPILSVSRTKFNPQIVFWIDKVCCFKAKINQVGGYTLAYRIPEFRRILRVIFKNITAEIGSRVGISAIHGPVPLYFEIESLDTIIQSYNSLPEVCSQWVCQGLAVIGIGRNWRKMLVSIRPHRIKFCEIIKPFNP